MNDPIFLELMRWGDFDIPITDGIWYKPKPTDQETTFHNSKILINKMFIEFMKLTGRKVSMETTSHSMEEKIYVNCKEDGYLVHHVFNEFKDYLIARGYRQLVTTKLHFTDGN